MAALAATSLWLPLLTLLWLQPASVLCDVKCSKSGLCPRHYLCCYNQECCPLSERVAELAGAVSGVVLLFGGLAFCCYQCCKTRRQYAGNPVPRRRAVVPTPTPAEGGDGDPFTEASPLIHDQPVTYGSHQDIS